MTTTDIRGQFLRILEGLIDAERRERRHDRTYEEALLALQAAGRRSQSLTYDEAIELAAELFGENEPPPWLAALERVRVALAALNGRSTPDPITGTTASGEIVKQFCLWHGCWADADHVSGASCNLEMTSTPPPWYVEPIPSYEGAQLTDQQETFSRGHARGWDDALHQLAESVSAMGCDRIHPSYAALAATRKQIRSTGSKLAGGILEKNIYRLARLRDAAENDQRSGCENVGREIVDALEMAGLLQRPEDDPADAVEACDPGPQPPDDPQTVIGTFETVIGYEGLETVDHRLIDCGAIDMTEWVPVLDLDRDYGTLIGRACLTRREATGRPDHEPQLVNEIVAQLVMYQDIDGRIPTFDIRDQTIEIRENGQPVDPDTVERRFFSGAPLVHATTRCKIAAVWLSADPALCWRELPAEIRTITVS